MVVYYKSFALSGIVLAGSFLSIIGVIVGHWVTDKIQLYATDTHFFLTATSLIGFISLMGISARSSLLLIDFSRSLIVHEGLEKKEAIALATATRAKPIMLTAVAIILGSLLLATDPIFGGLGVALIFGSIAATLVSLFFIPVLMDNTDALMSNANECAVKKKGTWCVLTDNLKSLFPKKRDETLYVEPVLKTDTNISEDIDVVPKEEKKSTWCVLTDNIKSFFTLKNAQKSNEITEAYKKAQNERDFIALHNLGNAHLKKQELDKAIEFYEQALKIKEDEGTRFKLELAMLQKKKSDKA